MSKILLFGGSFNPPHFAHLEIARLALKQSNAKELWFVPNLEHPFQKYELAPFELRALMLDELIKPYKKLKVCRIEAELTTPSYTIDTLQALEKRYLEHEFMWLMGSDQISLFDTWKASDVLKSRFPLFVYRRHFEDKIETPFIEIKSPKIYTNSSTNIRNGQVHVCPKNIVQFFVENELYLESISSSLISKKRFAHVLSVTKLALSLASAHNIDLHQTLLASLFHDCAKEMPMTKMKSWLQTMDPKYIEQATYLWHARVGSFWVKRNLYVEDQDILFAIQHHVHGDHFHPLTQVLYIADKCEETRGYDASALLKIAYQDLKKGFFAVKKHQTEFLEKDEK